MTDAKAVASQRAPAASGPLLGGGLSARTSVIFACACGAMVANLYYAQSLVGVIAPDLRLSPDIAGLIVTLTQIGYGVGLLFLVSLADLVENRRLVMALGAGLVASAAAAALSRSATVFLIASFLLGLCSVGAQVLVPLATYMTPSRTRGKVIGNIMSGLLAGIMLARPFASFVAGTLGWRAIFWFSAAFTLVILALLWRALPQRRPAPGLNYFGILTSTLGLLRKFRLVRRRAIYQGVLFATFNIFWTTAPLMLRDSFGLTQRGIAVFALAGAGGALAAPFAGRMADRGLLWAGTCLAMTVSIASFLLAGWAGAAGFLTLFGLAAITLDAATQTNHVISQRAIYSLTADSRARVNAAYMSLMFLFGALGSLVGGFAYAAGGWWASALLGAGAGCVVLLYFATE